MKRNSAELKRLARLHLRGRYGLPMGTWVVSMLITSCLLGIFSFFLNVYGSMRDMLLYQLISILVSLLAIPLSCGLLRIHLALARGKLPSFGDLFSCYRIRPDRFILGELVLIALILVCMLPCLLCMAAAYLLDSLPLLFGSLALLLGGTVAGIFVTLPLSLVFLLLTDYDQMGLNEALRKSWHLMQGNKGRYFYLQLSFLGMALLGVFSCYIGMLWIQPYITQTMVEFYRDVTGELDRPQPSPNTVLN